MQSYDDLNYAGPADPTWWPHQPPGDDHDARQNNREPALYQHDCNFPHDLATQHSHSPSHDHIHIQPDPPRPENETRSVCFAETAPKPTAWEDKELEELMLKMHTLTVCNPAYTILYAQICHRFPNMAKTLQPPDFRQMTAVAYQTPTSHLSNATTQRLRSQQAQSTTLSNEAASFFRKMPRTDGCAFCAQQGHIVQRCPMAEEYMRTGCATIISGRMYLVDGQPIPNDRSSHGLQHGIDTWLARAGMLSGESSPIISIQTSGTATLLHNINP